MANYYTLSTIDTFLAENADKIEKVKITKAEKVCFNNMVGSIYHINIKVITLPCYKNKFLKIETNSTWLEEWDGLETLQDFLKERFDYLVNPDCGSLDLTNTAIIDFE